jgi:hypothetical protein
MLLVLHGPMVLFFTLPPVRRVVMDKVRLRLLTKMRKKAWFQKSKTKKNKKNVQCRIQ